MLVHDGQFVATLRASTHTQTDTITAQIGAMQATTHVEQITDLRPSLASGVVTLSLGKKRLDYDRPMQDFGRRGDHRDDRSSVRISGAGFATGATHGALLSGAYSTDHVLNQTASGASSLGCDTQVQDQRYIVYGDSSSYEAQAQFQDHLFLRLERDDNYALWGDYGTNEFAGPSQQFTALTREFHAFKANFQTGRVQTIGFYGSNVQGFQRDSLTPDGTGGYYFLSHRPLVYGSESITLELDDLTRPGTPLSVTPVARSTDYEIDYDRGTVLFRRPLQRTDVGLDGRVLARHVIATYQYQTTGKGTDVYGGRMQMHLNGGGLLGATLVRQNQGLRRFGLYGADFLLPLGAGGTIIGEAARSQNGSDVLGQVNGTAFRVEAQGKVGAVQMRAYARTVGTGFANDATTSFVPGQTRGGAQASLAVTPRTHLRAQVDYEADKGTAPTDPITLAGQLETGTTALPGPLVNNRLLSVSAGVEQQVGRADVSVDVINRRRQDFVHPDTVGGSSGQLETRFSLPLPPRLTLLAQSDVTLTRRPDAVEPDRSLVGVGYSVLPGVDLRLNQQFFGRGQFQGRRVTSSDTVVDRPWGDGSYTERFSITGGANGATMQQALGLGRRWTVAPGLRLDAAYERVGGALLGRTQAGPQSAQTYAPGQSAASLGINSAQSESMGLEYTKPSAYKASARLDNRTSAGGRNVVITAAAAGKVSASLTSLLDYEQAQASNPHLAALGRSVTLRAGLAYRDPQRDTWNALMRYEFRRNPAVTPDTLLVGSGAGSREQTFALEGIYAPQWQWEFYGKLALRESTSYLANDYVGSSRLTLAQTRATYRIHATMDILGEARWISEPGAGYGSRGAHLEAGYFLSPDLRLGLGYSFGRLDDRDFNGSQWSGGPTLALTAKVDQLFGGFGVQRAAFDPPASIKPAAK